MHGVRDAECDELAGFTQDSHPEFDDGSGYLFASVRVVLARGPDGQASPRNGTSPRRDERCNLGAIATVYGVAETRDEHGFPVGSGPR